MLKAKGNEVLDETGKQMCVVLATSCTKRDAKRWAQYIVDRVNADERGKSFTKETFVVCLDWGGYHNFNAGRCSCGESNAQTYVDRGAAK